MRVGSMKRLMGEFNGKGMSIKGLWLTEFAGRSDAAGLCRTLAQQRGWLEVIVPMLNSEPAVVAYSWFSYGEGRFSATLRRVRGRPSVAPRKMRGGLRPSLTG